MFTYCGNNPVCRSDPSDCSWLADLFGGCFNIIKAAIDVTRNYIYNQTSFGIGSREFGVSTVAESGCGAVAIHNANLAMGLESNFSEVLDYFNEPPLLSNNRLAGLGLTGTTPNAVAQYYRDKGYRVAVTDNYNLIDAYSLTASASILYYEEPRTYNVCGVNVNAYGAHFIAYHKYAGEYKAYNADVPGGTAKFSSPAAYGYSDSRYYAVGIFVFDY